MPVAGSNKPAALVTLRGGELHIVHATFAPDDIILSHVDALPRLRQGESVYVSRLGPSIAELNALLAKGDEP